MLMKKFGHSENYLWLLVVKCHSDLLTLAQFDGSIGAENSSLRNFQIHLANCFEHLKEYLDFAVSNFDHTFEGMPVWELG